MIQRIQSLLLLLAAVAAFSLFKLPFGSTSEPLAASALFNDQVFNLQDNVGLLAILTLAGVLALAAIFLFKNRPLQLTLSRVSVVLNVVGIILGVVLFMRDSGNMGATTPKEEMGLGLPILGIIFALLAMRFINKDEKTVQDLNSGRLR